MLSRALSIAAVLGGLAWLERQRPLRGRTQPSGRRTAVNLAMAGITAVVVGPVQTALIDRASRWAERRRFGVLRWIPMPRWLARTAGVVLLDYTLWHWHRMNHRIGWLWSMHASHHADLDLDVSTALRFHVGEMLAAAPVRAAQVIVLGIDRATLRGWETALLIAIGFHHANLRLPARVDSAVSNVIITPRLHGIHHSANPDRLDTNFGTLLALWDMLHGTRDSELDQAQIAVGLPGSQGDR